MKAVAGIDRRWVVLAVLVAVGLMVAALLVPGGVTHNLGATAIEYGLL